MCLDDDEGSKDDDDDDDDDGDDNDDDGGDDDDDYRPAHYCTFSPLQLGLEVESVRVVCWEQSYLHRQDDHHDHYDHSNYDDDDDEDDAYHSNYDDDDDYNDHLIHCCCHGVSLKSVLQPHLSSSN